MAKRLQSMGQANYADGFKVTMHPHMLEVPLRLKKPQMVFVNSMSDLFHEGVSETFIKDIFRIMEKAHWHTFQVLTKRSARLAELAPKLNWPENVWAGVSVESESYAHRITDLQHVPAAVRFLSMEPLLAPAPCMGLTGIDWVIVGGESGPGSRPIAKSWVRDIRKQCRKADVPFFFKQWGGVNKKKTGRTLDGRIYDEMPSAVNELILAT